MITKFKSATKNVKLLLVLGAVLAISGIGIAVAVAVAVPLVLVFAVDGAVVIFLAAVWAVRSKAEAEAVPMARTVVAGAVPLLGAVVLAVAVGGTAAVAGAVVLAVLGGALFGFGLCKLEV